MRLCLLLLAMLLAAPLAARAQVDPAVLAAEQARIAVVEKASKATVAIFAKGGQGGGAGVLISADGYALSNFHVTNEAGTAMKCGLDNGVLYDAVIVGLDPTGDVALLKLLGRDDFPFAEMADSDRVRVGDWCFTIGNPFLLATDFHPTVSFGVVSGVHRYQYPAGTILEYADCIQADAAINPGNSGGPMFDAEGRLIGINGRGSFEKRGRVNVGVGYAISINQIKNFLGHLKSGRLVDHATLGASMISDNDRRVMVDEILEESDAYRRGLRYGDRVLAFGNRSVGTVNAYKNVLGIYPKGWRVPLTYTRGGERHEILVRLRGVHAAAELEEMTAEAPKAKPKRMPMPGKKPEPEKERPDRDGSDKDGPDKKPGDDGIPPGSDPESPHAEGSIPTDPATLPDIVKQHFIAKPGYVNFYFNQLHRNRVWQACAAHGDFTSLSGPWTISGLAPSADTGSLETFTFDLADKQAGIKLPSGELNIELTAELSNRLDPPESGGLLAALSLWRRLLIEGPDKFGDVTYWGTAPVPGHEGLCDVLVGTHGDVECRFLFDPLTSQLMALEMSPEDDTDPCELYFSDYRNIDGRQLPGRIEVRHGDGFNLLFQCQQFDLKPADAKPADAKSDEAKPAESTPAEKAEATKADPAKPEITDPAAPK